MPEEDRKERQSRPTGADSAPPVEAPQLLMEQTLSFVSHDLFGPLSMLRTYLQAVGDQRPSGDDLGYMLEDAVGMAIQLEGLAGVLRDSLRLLMGRLPIAPTRLDLFRFLEEWTRKNSAVAWRPPERCDPEGVCGVRVDRDILGRALEYAAWQIARMGTRRGDVGLTARSDDQGQWHIVLTRTDVRIEEGVLARALEPYQPDQLSFLRRLPASGYPLCVSRGLVEAMGGKVRVGREEAASANLTISFPCAACSHGITTGTKAGMP